MKKNVYWHQELPALVTERGWEPSLTQIFREPGLNWEEEVNRQGAALNLSPEQQSDCFVNWDVHLKKSVYKLNQ